MIETKTTTERLQETSHAEEVRRGERFEFGKNWQRFLLIVDDERIAAAERSLKETLEVESLCGKTFLDVGSGSGLFSLAARKLGARVRSFDYDPQSVACTTELRRRYFPGDAEWCIDEASVLDARYLESLGTFNIVYSWGVLHQTGDMWQALDRVSRLVERDGKLLISIYNDQGIRSRRWRLVKRAYNHSPRLCKFLLVVSIGAYRESRAALGRLVRLHNPLSSHSPKETDGAARGMSRWHDLVDWVGGYPHEVARPEELLDFFRSRQFVLLRLTTVGGGHGCNEFVFSKQEADEHATIP